MVAREMKLSYMDTGLTLPFTGNIMNSSELAKILRQIFDPNEVIYREHFYALYFSNNNTLLGYKHISSGGITGTMADIRIILQGALLANAVGLAISHNHPSGNLKPSVSDIELTRKINQAAKCMDIRLFDHIILTEHSYYSFNDEGQI